LKDVRAWERFGFGSRGNLIVYGDCLVFASARHALLNSVLNVRETLKYMYPYVQGVWGDDQNELLKRVLGDKLVPR
jgi:hypothetical protein